MSQSTEEAVDRKHQQQKDPEWMSLMCPLISSQFTERAKFPENKEARVNAPEDTFTMGSQLEFYKHDRAEGRLKGKEG